MDARRRLDDLLANPECHAILVNALGDYVAMLEGHIETFASQTEVAYVERSIHHAESLRDVFERWP